jgi:Tfp pilus assembly protein PilX
MKKYFLQIQKKKEKGFALLFAVLVSTLVVSIGASIISIALRQTLLSGTSRESQYAFYAANTVLECAFYWDITNPSVFPAPGDTQISSGDSDASDINCSGVNIITGDGATTSFPRAWDTSVSDQTTFYIEIKDTQSVSPGGATQCAQATVKKSVNASGIITTKIEARGYNTCDLKNPRAVERGLIQEYKS